MPEAHAAGIFGRHAPVTKVGFNPNLAYRLADAFTLRAGLSYTGGQALDISGYLPLELPAFAELASHHELTDNWALHASANWTRWSVFEELVAYFPGETKPAGGLESDLVKVENFEDSWRFTLSSSYRLNDTWLLRAGVALDQTVVDYEYRTASIPDSDRLWFTLGTAYQASKELTVDFSLGYIKSSGQAPITEE